MPLRFIFSWLLVLSYCQTDAQVWQQWHQGGEQLLVRKIAVMDSNTITVLMNKTPSVGSATQSVLKLVDKFGAILDSIAIDSTLAFDLIRLSSGDMVLAGTKFSGNESLGWVAKLDSSFNLIWEKIYVGASFSAVAEGESGNIYLGGETPDNSTPVENHGLLKKVDANGNQVWSSSFDIGPNETSVVGAIVPLASNKILIGGEIFKFGLGDGFFTARFNAVNGAKLSEWFDYHSEALFGKFSFNVTAPTIGFTRDNGNDFVFTFPAFNTPLIKFDSLGFFKEQFNFPSNSFQKNNTSIRCDDDGNYLIAGGVILDGRWQTPHPYIEKRKPSGELVWTRIFRETGSIQALEKMPDGHLMVGGLDTMLLFAPPCNAYLARLSSNGSAYPQILRGRVVLDADKNCLPDSSAIGVPGQMFVLDQKEYFETDSNGYFQANIAAGQHQLDSYLNSPLLELCPSSSFFQVSQQDSLVELVFNYQKRKECPLMEVGITMSDLIICDTSNVFVSWVNTGNSLAEDVTIDIELDNHLTLLEASQAYTQTANKLVFQLGDLQPNESGVVEMKVKLSCDAPTFANHCIRAEIGPVKMGCYVTQPNWSDAAVTAEGRCEDGAAIFTVSNQGASPFDAPVPYQLYADGALMLEGAINFQNDQPVEIEWPANGHTISLTLQQPSLFPVESDPSYNLEGCGIGQNGFFSTGFSGIFGSNDSEPWVSVVCAENDYLETNDNVTPHSKNYGYYRLVSHDAEWFEYSVKVKNPLDAPIFDAVLEIMPTADFQRESFQPIAGPGDMRFDLMSDGSIKVFIANCHIPAGEQMIFRFRIWFEPSSDGSYAEIAAFAYLNGQRAGTSIFPAYTNISEGFISSEISPDPSINDIHSFGRGSSLDWVADADQAPNGDIYVAGTTHKEGDGYWAYLVRTDSLGVGVWQKDYALSEEYFSTRTALALPDQTVLLGGSMQDTAALASYLETNFCYLTKIDQQGELVWTKKWKPKTGWGGEVVESMITADGNMVVWGVMGTLASYQWNNFLRKMTPEGDLIWQAQINNGDYFLGIGEGKLQELPDGRFILGGQPYGLPEGTHFLMIEISPNGAVLGNHFVQVPPQGFYPTCTSYVPTADGGYMLACNHPVGGGGFGDMDMTPRMVKLDSGFEVDWWKIPFDNELGDLLMKDIVFLDGHYYVYGSHSTSDTIGGVDESVVLIKFNEAISDWDYRIFDSNARENAINFFVGQHNRLWMTAQTQTIDWMFNLQMLLLTSTPAQVTAVMPETDRADGMFLHVFPNPARDILYYELPDSFGDAGKWEIFDVSGIVVARGQIQTTKSIPIEVLPAGIYFFRCNNANQACMGRFLKI